MDKNNLYRSIPKVDILLEDPMIRRLRKRYGHEMVMEEIREQTDHLRERIRISTDSEEESVMAAVADLIPSICRETERLAAPRVRRVINATGTILHTNLGRAPISRRHAQHLTEIVTGYSNLEFDLAKRDRSERYAHFEDLLCRLTGAEAAMVVNNNAAAVMLILSTLAKGGEVIVSRGELVEIGGKFRIPDVCSASGAILAEVGTTNKTHLSDYEEAITEQTRAILKVHPSNYHIVGFTESVPVKDLKPLAEEKDVVLIEDLGSGVLVDLSRYGRLYEPTVQESVAAGADVVCFSGDKLLGGPQAGIIIGKKKYIQAMKKNPLTRALRVDKFTVAALEMVLLEYLREDTAREHIPVLRMITESQESVAARAERLARLLLRLGCPADIHTEACESQVGGGSLPMERIPSMAVVIRSEKIRTARLEQELLQLPVPILGRTIGDAIWLDVRTLDEEELTLVAEGLKEVLA